MVKNVGRFDFDKDYYADLALADTATAQDIDAARKKIIPLLSPSTMNDPMTQAFQDASDLLTDPDLKQQYDLYRMRAKASANNVAAPADPTKKETEQQKAAGRIQTIITAEEAKDFNNATGPNQEKGVRKLGTTVSSKIPFWKSTRAFLIGSNAFTFFAMLYLTSDGNEKTQKYSLTQQQLEEIKVESFNAGKAEGFNEGKTAGLAENPPSAGAPPYDGFRDAILRNGAKLSVPAEFLLKMDSNKQKNHLANVGKIAQVDPLSEFVAWGTDNANMNGRVIVVTDESLIQSEQALEVIVSKALPKIKTYPESVYHSDIVPVTYQFNLVADPADPAKKKVELKQITNDKDQVLETFDL